MASVESIGYTGFYKRYYLVHDFLMANKISKIERISILTKLVLQYSPGGNLVRSVRLAKDLADVLDEIRRSGLNVKDEDLGAESIQFLPEHWKRRVEFVTITMEHWPMILKDIGKFDV
jgi:inactivated superfamily I helicase